MATGRPRRSRVRAIVLFPLRVIYRVTFFILTMLVLAPAQALKMTPRIERPEKKNRIVQVDQR